jgi:hypothetical protein
MEHKPKVFKPKKCAWKKCGKQFTPERNFQKTCFNTMCAYGYVNQQAEIKKEKDWNKEKKIIKGKMMSLSDHLKDLQENYFNPYIRERDKGNPCISCKTTQSNRWDAGHWWPAGNYSYLRFNEDNVHLQCSFNCNRSKHGNVNEYRINLIEKIGIERVLKLETDRHKKLELTIPDIIQLKEDYKLKIKQLKAYG